MRKGQALQITWHNLRSCDQGAIFWYGDESMRRRDHKLGNHLPHASRLTRYPDQESEKDVVKRHETWAKTLVKKNKRWKGARERERKAWCLLPAFFALNHSKCRVKEMCQLPSAPVEEEKGKQGLGLKFKGWVIAQVV